MQIKRWQRFGLLASVAWLVVGCLLASRNESWIAGWKLYCSLTADPTCVNATVFLVAHWDAIVGIVLCPPYSDLAHCLGARCPEAADTAIRAWCLNSGASSHHRLRTIRACPRRQGRQIGGGETKASAGNGGLTLKSGHSPKSARSTASGLQRKSKPPIAEDFGLLLRRQQPA